MLFISALRKKTRAPVRPLGVSAFPLSAFRFSPNSPLASRQHFA